MRGDLKLFARGGLESRQVSYLELEQREAFVDLPAKSLLKNGEQSDWFFSAGVQLPPASHLGLDLGADFKKSALGNNVVTGDYSPGINGDTALFAGTFVDRTQFATQAAVTMGLSSFLMKAGWKGNWLYVPAHLPPHDVFLSLGYESPARRSAGSIRWGGEARTDFGIHWPDNVPELEAMAYLMPTENLRLALELKDMIKLFSGRRRVLVEALREGFRLSLPLAAIQFLGVNMIELIRSGGPLMVPLGLCALLATFIILERFIYYSSVKRKDKFFLDRLLSLIHARRFDEALAWCKDAATPAAQVAFQAIFLRHLPESDLKELVAAELDRQVPRLDKFITALGTIANVATLLGLLGTVTGNIQAFGVLGAGQSMGNPSALADSIAEALVTTAAGLCISIPAVIFHNHFVATVNRRVTAMESIATAVVIQVCGRNLVGKNL